MASFSFKALSLAALVAFSGSAVSQVVISEVMYHPTPPTEDDLAIYVGLTEDDLEYVEIDDELLDRCVDHLTLTGGMNQLDRIIEHLHEYKELGVTEVCIELKSYKYYLTKLGRRVLVTALLLREYYAQTTLAPNAV